MIAAALAVLLAAPPAPPAGPMMVFWSAGRTYLVDVETARLYVAPEWITSTPDGLWRYRLRVDAHRARRARGAAIPPPSRWTTFEQLAPGATRYTPLTAVPTPPGEGQISDEHRVVQLTGDTVTLTRHFRRRSAAHPTPTTPAPITTTRRADAWTLDLPAGERRPLPPDTDPALDWLRATLPGVLDPCVDRPAGRITLDLPGGHPSDWLVVRGEADACAGDAHALQLDAADPARPGLVGARWQDDALIFDDGRRLEDVVDVRPGPADAALVLRGEPLALDAPLHRDLMRLDDPCQTRELSLHRPGRPPALLGDVAALDGARALAPDDPLRAARDTWFRPIGATPCHAALPLDTDPVLAAHRCQIDEDGRPWRGPDDLAALVTARLETRGGRLHLELEVIDPDRAPGDGVRLYLGARRRPQRVAIGADGVQIRGGSRTRRRVRRQLDTTHAPTREGYRITATLDRALLGDPPSISVAVEDHDPGVDGAVWLWVAGTPIDGRNPRATPLFAEEKR